MDVFQKNAGKVKHQRNVQTVFWMNAVAGMQSILNNHNLQQDLKQSPTNHTKV